MTISRRDFLKIGGASCIVAGAGAALAGRRLNVDGQLRSRGRRG